LLTAGSVQTEIKTYVVPEKYRERLAKIDPVFVPPKSEEFQVLGQHLKIDVKSKTVTLTGTLKVKDKNDEQIELACSFNPSEAPWICTDMIPTNEKIAAEKRLQATFKCLDTYTCEKVGVKLWVVINGVLQEPQLFQAEGFQIRRASSGDDDTEEFVAPAKTFV